MRLSADRIGMLLFVGVGLLNVAPGLLAVLPSRLAATYGAVADDATSTLLLRHRAVLLGLLGVALLVAAFRPYLRMPALVAAAVSKLSFLALVFGASGEYPKLIRVGLADVVALVALAAAAILTRTWPAWLMAVRDDPAR